MKAALYTIGILVVMTVCFIPSLIQAIHGEVKRKIG
jgi:hypothetical protein